MKRISKIQQKRAKQINLALRLQDRIKVSARPVIVAPYNPTYYTTSHEA